MLVTPSGLQSGDVKKFHTASELNRHSETLKDSLKRRRHDYKGESLFETWTRFKDLLKTIPHHSIDHVSIHLKSEIDRAASGKLRDKNAKESWEIIENLSLYGHEGWDDPRDFAKSVKEISLPHNTPKMPDRRLLELEDQISYLLKDQERYLKKTQRTFLKHMPSFEARVQGYMAAHTERIERFEEAIFKQIEEINNIIADMFGLLKELTASRTPEKVLKGKNAENNKVVDKNVIGLSELNAIKPNGVVDIMKEELDGTNDEPVRNLIEGLIGNQRYNDSLLATHLGKMDHETYNSLPRGPMYNAALKKKITKKQDMEGNFMIPCNIRGLKYMDALVDQGSDVNVMPLSIYNRLTNEKPVGTNIRLPIASHTYIFPLDKKKPFILGAPFLTIAKAEIRFYKGTITLKSGKNKINFFKIPESPRRVKVEVKNDIDLVAPTNIVSRLILEWEERIKLHQEKKWSLTNGEVIFDDEKPRSSKEFHVEDSWMTI
ncbi:hypothetical protein Tco_0322715 [Tanacetum coccineum]